MGIDVVTIGTYGLGTLAPTAVPGLTNGPTGQEKAQESAVDGCNPISSLSYLFPNSERYCLAYTDGHRHEQAVKGISEEIDGLPSLEFIHMNSMQRMLRLSIAIK